MDGVTYAEETAGSVGALKVTLSSSEPPLYGSGPTSAFLTFSGYHAFRKTSRTDCTQSQRLPLRSPYSGKDWVLGTCCALKCFPYTVFDFAYTDLRCSQISRECSKHCQGDREKKFFLKIDSSF